MINITSKEEIIIPFDVVGDDKWMENTKLIIEEFADNWSRELKTPVSQTEIVALENRIGTTLPKSLSLFYQVFGAADIGEELLNCSQIDKLNNFWQGINEYSTYFTNAENKLLPYLIAFSDSLGSGDIFCFHSETKAVYFFDHSEAPFISKLFDDVSSYIKGCLILAQTDLFAIETGQEAVEQWCEEILEALYGTPVIRKWLY